jgi:hypothetical protein
MEHQMPKSDRSKSDKVAAAASTQRKTTISERETSAPKEPKQLAEEWSLKIQQHKKAAEQGKRALAEIIIPYFNKVQREMDSEDFSFGVLELKDLKPVRVHFRLGSGATVAISVTPEGVIFEKSDGSKENITDKIDVDAPTQTIANITELVTAFM